MCDLSILCASSLIVSFHKPLCAANEVPGPDVIGIDPERTDASVYEIGIIVLVVSCGSEIVDAWPKDAAVTDGTEDHAEKVV